MHLFQCRKMQWHIQLLLNYHITQDFSLFHIFQGLISSHNLLFTNLMQIIKAVGELMAADRTGIKYLKWTRFRKLMSSNFWIISAVSQLIPHKIPRFLSISLLKGIPEPTRAHFRRPNRLPQTTLMVRLYSAEINSSPQAPHHLSHHLKWWHPRGNRCFLLLPRSVINHLSEEIQKIRWNNFHWLWPVRRESLLPASSLMIQCNLFRAWPSSSHR